jgi:hypothetical protein
MYIITQSMSDVESFTKKCLSRITHTGKLWGLPCFSVKVGVDTEYVQNPNNPNTMLTTQIALSEDHNDCIVLEHPYLEFERLSTWECETALSIVLGSNTSPMPLERPVDGYMLVEVLVWFAPADVLAGLFTRLEDQRYIQRFIRQDGRMNICTSASTSHFPKPHSNKLQLPYTVKYTTPEGEQLTLRLTLQITDLAKLVPGSLQNAVTTFGGIMLDKSLMDSYKTNMMEPYMTNSQELFDNYMKYAKDDACQLFFLEKANKVRQKALFDVHGISTSRTILSTGALVNDLFIKFIRKKLGVYDFSRLYTVDNGRGKERAWGLADILKRSSVSHFAGMDSHRAVNALVQGGRAKNNLSTATHITGVLADLDKGGAYASVMKQMIYPVGLPAVFGGSLEGKKARATTLGQFLKYNESELVDRCYQIVVSGLLSFDQTLISSKNIESAQISQRWNSEKGELPAEFRFYSREIKNGLITSDILQIIRNVSSNAEKKGFMELEVVSAVWYPKSLQCLSAEECFEKIKEHHKLTGGSVEMTTDKKGKERIEDGRGKFWYGISISDFLTPYTDMRKEFKDEMKKHKKGSPEYLQFDALQTQMKLVGNTLYGTFACPQLTVSNVVVANNITAALRGVIWCASVALNGYQDITDGFLYDMNNVNFKSNSGSMNTLSNLRRPQALSPRVKKFLKVKPLGDDGPWKIDGSGKMGRDLFTTISNNSTTMTANEGGWNGLNELTLAHVAKFFESGAQPISLLKTTVDEHKDVYVSATFHGQTNYQFEHATGELKTKARGNKLKGRPYTNNEEARIIELFTDIRERPNSIPAYHPQTIPQVLKCNQANMMLESKTNNIYKRNGLVAGDSILKRSHLKPISLSVFQFLTHEQYLAWDGTVRRLREKTGWGLELFFLNDDGSVRYLEALETIKEKISDGENFLFPLVKRGVNTLDSRMEDKYHPFWTELLQEPPEENDDGYLDYQD